MNFTSYNTLSNQKTKSFYITANFNNTRDPERLNVHISPNIETITFRNKVSDLAIQISQNDNLDLFSFIDEYSINYLHLLHTMYIVFKDRYPELYEYYLSLFEQNGCRQDIFYYNSLFRDNKDFILFSIDTVVKAFSNEMSIYDITWEDMDNYIELKISSKTASKVYTVKLYCELDLLLFVFIMFHFM